MSYPEVITFKDSVVASTLLGVFMTLLSIFGLWTYFDSGENGLVILICAPIAIVLLISAFVPTKSTLTPEGIEVKAWSGTVFNKWSDMNDLRVYNQTGYMGVGRRYVTFQDETKTCQKHVFLVPINIWSKPSEVLGIVQSYKEAVLNSQRFD